MKLSDIAAKIGAELVGDPEIEIHSIAALEDAGPGQLSFLSNTKYLKDFKATRASAVIVPTGVESSGPSLLRCKDSYYAFAQAMVLLHGHRRHPHVGVHPRANVDPTATIGENTVIYPGAFVGPHTRIGQSAASVYQFMQDGRRRWPVKRRARGLYDWPLARRSSEGADSEPRTIGGAQLECQVGVPLTAQ